MRTVKNPLLPNILKNLEIMGNNIRIARLRRNLSTTLICDRAGISRPTLMRVEKGSPDVSIGIYAAVLNAIGNNDVEFCNIMKEDKLGRTLQDLNIKTPRRARKWIH